MPASYGREAAQKELEGRRYAACADLCAEALAVEPENLDVRILRARALMALRRDEEATREVSRALRWHPDSSEAYRLLGELAIRRGKLTAAATFLAHAVRLAPDDATSLGLLDLVRSSSQPTVAVEELPAATATVGCSVLASLAAEKTEPSASRPRRMAAGSQAEQIGLQGFGRYLVDIGALTPRQLRAALDYHRRAGIRVGAAAVALGFLSEPRVEWAAYDYHSTRHVAG